MAMTQSPNVERELPTNLLIGVGLRHQHFTEALTERANIDFVEVHSENFFAEGGASRSVLRAAAEKYAISLHSTAMGLGSAQGVPDRYLSKLAKLADDCEPLLMSDHACFTWSELQGKPVHGGDLLPLVYNEQTLTVFANNLDRIQQRLGIRSGRCLRVSPDPIASRERPPHPNPRSASPGRHLHSG